VHQLLISCKFSTFPQSHDCAFVSSSQPSPSLQHDPKLWSHACHIIEAFQYGKGASQLSVPEFTLL